MPYLGRSTDGFGVRDRFVFTASGSETSISGADDNSRTLKFEDGTYVDVYLNGVLLLRDTDYNTTTANTIGSLASLAASDVVEIIVYDVFSVANTVPQTGGTYNGSVTFNNNITVEGNINDENIYDDRTILLDGTDSSFTNEGSKILLDGTDGSGTNAGDNLIFETDTLSSLTKEDPDVIVLEDNDENGILFQDTSTNARVSTTKIVLESGTQFATPNDLSAPKITGVSEIANVGGGQNTNFDNSVSVDIKAMSLGVGSHILDLNRNANFELTLSGNITLANPAELTAGTTGSIFVVQDGTGSRTVAYGSVWDFAAGTAPTMTTTASAVDRIDYIVRSSTKIHAVATLAYS